MSTNRICKNCNYEIEPDNLKYVRGYVQKICKDCFNKEQRDKRIAGDYDKYKGKYRETLKKWKLETKYGITLEEFNNKLELQSGGCAVCKKEFTESNKPHVDHNHETGKVRDLLCFRCNAALGLVHEDEDFIWDILEYLKRHENPTHERTFETITVQE